MKRIVMFIWLAITCALIVGCNEAPKITPKELEKITVEMIEKKNTADGKFYSLKLSNNSKYTITQNNVYVSYNIKIEKGEKGNDFKVLTRNNRLHIKPNEAVILTANVPKEMYEGNQYINIDEPYVDIMGYIVELKGERMFHSSGPLH